MLGGTCTTVEAKITAELSRLRIKSGAGVGRLGAGRAPSLARGGHGGLLACGYKDELKNLDVDMIVRATDPLTGDVMVMVMKIVVVVVVDTVVCCPRRAFVDE